MPEPLGLAVFRAVRDRAYDLGWYVAEGERDADDREMRLTLRPWDPEPNTGDDPS